MEERMIQKKVMGTRMRQRRITGRWCSRTSTSTVLSALLLAGLSSIKVISSCVISPSESVAIVGDRISFSCNARPTNQQRGSISYINLGSEGASGIEIFRPARYNSRGQKITNQTLADGYFLSQYDDIHTSSVTLQINKTQLKHGGQYFCSCDDSMSKLGTANFTVLDKLSFVRSGDEVLNCSVSFNGSTSFAFIDLTINNANVTEVSSKRNLSLISNVTGHHAIRHEVVADPKKVQRFTCEVKVWNKSSTGESPLRSMTSSLNLGRIDVDVTTSADYSKSTASQKEGRGAFIAVGVTGTLLLMAVFIAICIYMKCRTQSNTDVIAQPVDPSNAANQDSRYNDTKRSIEHPSHMMPLQNSEDKKQRNNAMPVNNDVTLFENDIYEASSAIDPADCRKTTEQIYDQVL